jgi:DNA processing protein
MKISDFKIQKKGKYFYRGNWDEKIFTKSIAIVGSRQMTRFGGEMVDKFVADFVDNKITTVSGFMYGVDTAVHQKTVEYGGRTVAVLGCGLDVIYPSENEKLYLQILESGGLIISEYDKDAQPHLWKFPQRNKVVVKLSTLGVLVIEAGEGSGSLITAKIAIKSGKDVYAVPGPITSKVSVGTNSLIKKGEAKLVTSASDIIKIHSTIHKSQSITHDLNSLETKIFNLLELEPLEIDEIAQKIGENVIEIGSTLSLMGIKNLVTESGGKYYLNK